MKKKANKRLDVRTPLIVNSGCFLFTMGGLNKILQRTLFSNRFKINYIKSSVLGRLFP